MDKSIELRRVAFTQLANDKTAKSVVRVYESAVGRVSLQVRGQTALNTAHGRRNLADRNLIAHADLSVTQVDELIALLTEARDGAVS